jgi:anti-sigma B factor antagonist
MQLTLATRRLGDVIILTCAGRIVLGPEAKYLNEQVMELVPESPRHVVLQLRDVIFMDSSGMGTLVRLLTVLKAKGIKLSLCSPPQLVEKALSVTNILKLFGVYASEEDAVKAAYSSRPEQNSLAHADSVLCIGDTADIRAYLGAVVRAAGYQPLTCGSLYDATILISAGKPKLIVVGSPALAGVPNLLSELKASALPVLTLDEDFAVLEASAAGEKLTARIRELMRSGAAQQASGA